MLTSYSVVDIHEDNEFWNERKTAGALNCHSLWHRLSDQLCDPRLRFDLAPVKARRGWLAAIAGVQSPDQCCQAA